MSEGKKGFRVIVWDCECEEIVVDERCECLLGALAKSDGERTMFDGMIYNRCCTDVSLRTLDALDRVGDKLRLKLLEGDNSLIARIYRFFIKLGGGRE